MIEIITSQVINYIRNPKVFLRVLLNFVSPLIKDDRRFVKLKWKLYMDYALNLDNPVSFNEKLQWLKLNDRKPEYTKMVDKYEAKKYAASIIGEEHIIPTLAVYNSVEEIDFNDLPDQFVLKCTHDSGGLVICKNKRDLDVKATKRKLNKYFKRHYYWHNREYPYRDVVPRIIAEQYLSSPDGDLYDYKVFTFSGEPRIIEVDYNRFKGHQRTLFDLNWSIINATIGFPTDKNRKINRPPNLEKLLDFSRLLSKGTRHLRTDFYIVGDKIYFGELTFFHGSGLERIDPYEFDLLMGNMVDIS